MILKTFDLPLARDYVAHWGLPEAVRELLQNAIDSDSPMEYAFEGSTLSITSRYTTLEAKTLVLGGSSKGNDRSKIGSFGEGYKLALLVLTRLGYAVEIHNGNVCWTPAFIHSQLFDTEVLRLTETPLADNTGLTFLIQGLSHEDSNAVRDHCLFMQPPMDDVIGTKYGSILPSRPGKLYVGGLFVTDTDTQFGYDVLPQFLKLERDRQTVAAWDLYWLVKNMWLDTQRWDELAQLMEAQTPDVKHIEFDCPEILKEACYRKFKAANPGHIAVNSQKALDDAVAKGMTKTVYVSGGYYHAVSTHKEYVAEVKVALKHQTPAEFLTEWLSKHQREMRHPIRVAFQALIAQASKWKG